MLHLLRREVEQIAHRGGAAMVPAVPVVWKIL